MSSHKENAIRLLDGKSRWEDLGELKGCPQWTMLSYLPKLTQAQKLCILALTQDLQTASAVEAEAGLKGSTPVSPGVRSFWRRVSHRLVTIEPYSRTYRSKLDELYGLNQQLVFRDQALVWLPKANQADAAIYGSGRLPLEHLKTRARMHTLSVFIEELMDFKS